MVALDDYTTVRLQMWDIAGQERYGTMTHVYYKEAVGAFIVFDITRRPTFDSVLKWRSDIAEKVTLPDGQSIPVVLLANKCDLKKESRIPDVEIKQFVHDQRIDAFFYTSPKEDTGLDDAIGALVTKIMESEQISPFADSTKFKVNNRAEDDVACCLFA
jgi:Ras-related protein Rab-32